MRHIAKYSFFVAILLSAALVVVAVVIAAALNAAPPASISLPLLQFELDVFKAILAGFVVGMLGILIPAVASEAKQRFEQRKESRIAYSEAKTGVDYLKLRLSTATLKEASEIVQAVHFKKHIAELFDDFPEWLKKRFGPKATEELWDERTYQRLFGAREVLESNAGIWDSLAPDERIAKLAKALPTQSELDMCLPSPALAESRREPRSPS